MKIINKTNLTSGPKLLETEIGKELKKLFETPDTKFTLQFNKKENRLEFKEIKDEITS